MTSVDDEWYWLRRIAEALEASVKPDALAIAQVAISSVGTIVTVGVAFATLGVAALAAFTAKKSHDLSQKVAQDEAARVEGEVRRVARVERSEFAKKYHDYLSDFILRWVGRWRGEAWSWADAVDIKLFDLSGHAGLLGDDPTTGATYMFNRLSEFKEAVKDWPLDLASGKRVLSGASILMDAATTWAREGVDRPIPETDGW